MYCIISVSEAQKINAHSNIFCKDCINKMNPKECYNCGSGSNWGPKESILSRLRGAK